MTEIYPCSLLRQHPRAQNALTLIAEVVQESVFSDASYNSTCVSDVQSFIAKSRFTLQQFFGFFLTQDRHAW